MKYERRGAGWGLEEGLGVREREAVPDSSSRASEDVAEYGLSL